MSEPTPETAAASAEARMRAAYQALPLVLIEHDADDVEALSARLELVRACAEAGLLDDALLQVRELHKDAGRRHGREHPMTREARTLHEELEARADASGV